jgi:uncharacterized protein (DUF1684 family)
MTAHEQHEQHEPHEATADRSHAAAQDHEHAHEPAHEHAHEQRHEHHGPEPTYEEAVLEERAAKDTYFRTSHGSPIPHDHRHSYAGLRYYAPNPAYRLEGLALEPDPDPTDTTEVATSDGKTRLAWRVGSIEFGVPTGRSRLVGYAFEPGPVTEVFVPFRDATSGSETYGAGRYLDLAPEDDGTYTLDFNLAYNPWCAYAPQYSCPLPPPENWLPIAIPAGEQIPEETPAT